MTPFLPSPTPHPLCTRPLYSQFSNGNPGTNCSSLSRIYLSCRERSGVSHRLEGPGWQPLADSIIAALQISTSQKGQTVFLGPGNAQPRPSAPSLTAAPLTPWRKAAVLKNRLSKIPELCLRCFVFFPSIFSSEDNPAPQSLQSSLTSSVIWDGQA